MEKYVAYVSTYTMGDSHGIRIYDVDMENGRFMEKDKVEITNSSYITISHNSKYLYYVKEWWISIETNVSTVYWTLEKAKEIQKQNDWKFIMEELNSKWTTWEKYSKQNQELQEENEQLKKENEELKSLPPVEVETIHNEFDDPQDENLTKSKEKPVTVWKNKRKVS